MAELKAIKANAHGRVQGVFYRASTRNRARDLELTGTVRNLPGWHDVEVYAEGEKEQLEKLIDFMKKGPPGADVERVDVEWSDFSGSYKGFNIIF